MKINALRFGVALGLVYGVSLVFLAWLAWWFQYGNVWVDFLATVYYGYAASFPGGVLGFFWGFVDFFVLGFVFAWLYNRLLGPGCGCGCKDCQCGKGQKCPCCGCDNCQCDANCACKKSCC